jgi:hypothetical protein
MVPGGVMRPVFHTCVKRFIGCMEASTRKTAQKIVLDMGSYAYNVISMHLRVLADAAKQRLLAHTSHASTV